MTASGDGIAPVTYLFGVPAGAPSAPAVDDDGWYVDGSVSPTSEPTRATAAQPSDDDSTRLARARVALAAAEAEAAAAHDERESARTPDRTERPDKPDRPTRRAANVSMNALARKGMSSAEMTRLLEARELEPDAVSAEIDRLESAGLLDDQALAENLVRTLQERKGLGRSAITAELRRRKLDDSAITEAVDAIESDTELARAFEIAEKRASQLSSYDAETAKRRLGAYLMRRGYSGSVVSAALAHALEKRGPRFS